MIDLNVCLIPPKKLSDYCIETSDKVSKNYSTLFKLGDDIIPHISLYHISIPKKNLSKLKKALHQYCLNLPIITTQSDKYYQHIGYVHLSIIKTKALLKLHLDIANLLNPLREGLLNNEMKNYLATDKDLTINQKAYINKYGHPSIDKGFHPHITITKTDNPSISKDIAKSIGDYKYKFENQKIYLGTIGKYGTLPKILEEYKLK
jgi:2'-5' RNA ligase